MCSCKQSCGCSITSTTKGEKGDSSISSILGYKEYTGLISQAGTAAPTVDVQVNTLGDVIWTRASAGFYLGTLTGAFPLLKTNVYIQPIRKIDELITKQIAIVSVTNDRILITTGEGGTGEDDILYYISFTIKVFN